MIKECDNTSSGVIIRDHAGRFALLRRGRGSIGMAPAAGHIDDHGSPEQAAAAEAWEEVGVRLALGALKKTVIFGRDVHNHCRRPGGDHHVWHVFEADVPPTTLNPDPQETKGAGWYSSQQLNDLANRTRDFQAGRLSPEAWEAEPGLEEVWLPFMEELGYVNTESKENT